MNSPKELVHWFLRAALAGIFLFHGLLKFPMGPESAAMLGWPVAEVYALATIECLAGLLILYGGLRIGGSIVATRIAGLIMAVIMLGAVLTVHWGQWSFLATEFRPMGGMEFQVTILAIALFFLIRGNEV